MSGPDFLFVAAFAPANAAGLALAVRQFDFQHFARHAATDQYCRQHAQQCSYDLYIDTRNYLSIVGNIQGPQTVNVWIYHTIAVCRESLSIERGYGGYGDSYQAEERRLLRWLVQIRQLEPQSWKALSGGDGYAYTAIAAGSSGAELLDYLDAAP
jgi:hypothetical protein